MANFNTDTQVKTGFFHALGYVLTKFSNSPFNEQYKSAHNVRSNEIWVDSIEYSFDFEAAESESVSNSSVTQVGDTSQKALLYPLKNSDRQAWFLDTGTPTYDTNGFIPSDGWVKPLISPVDVTNTAGAPSLGFSLRLFRPDGIEISPGNGRWEVDYYSGIIKFQEGYTPTDTGNGLQFEFDVNTFLSAPDKVAFLETEGPRAIAFQYTGQYLSDATFGTGGGSYSLLSVATESNTGVGLAADVYQGLTESSGITTFNIKGIRAGDDSIIITQDDNNVYIQAINNISSFSASNTISFTQSDNKIEADIIDNSITTAKINSVNGATAGYVLSNDGTGNFQWVEAGLGGGAITMQDYNTGASFSNVQNIIIRGGIVSVPPTGATAVGASALQSAPNTVTVWIPAPSYEGPFSPSFTTSYLNRYVAEPTNDITNGSVAGEYSTGDWNTTTDFSTSTTRRVFNVSSISNAFITNDFFNCYGPLADGVGTTMSFYVYDGASDVIASIDNFVIELSGLTSSSNLSMQVLAFEADSDRKKAKVSGSIDIGTILPYGGRFYYEVKHYNGEPNNEVITFTSSDLFFDSPDSQTGVSSTAKINGDVTFDEAVPQIRKYSGVSYYTTNSTFGVTVSNIDLLNEITFPTTKQIDVVTTNMAISSQHPGFADGSKAAGALITGWGINWDSSNLTYSVIANVDLTGPSTGNGKWIPGFSTNNTISTTANSFMTSNIYDYGEADDLESLKKLMLFDTVTPGTATYNNNPITSESGRLQVVDPTQNFDSTAILSNLELQYIFGRVIFPQTNFTQFYPSVNFGASVDYSLLTGNNTNFDVITVLNDGGNPASSVVQSFAFNNYRWWVSSFGLSSNYGVPGLGLPVGNGVFTFNANFEEQDLHKNRNVGGVSNEDLAILVGYDSTGADTAPDKFLFISADPVTYPGRAQNTTYNFDGLITSKRIAFDAGAFPDTIVGEKSKIWLFVGYKDSTRGKNIYFSSVSFSSL